MLTESTDGCSVTSFMLEIGVAVNDTLKHNSGLPPGGQIQNSAFGGAALSRHGWSDFK